MEEDAQIFFVCNSLGDILEDELAAVMHHRVGPFHKNKARYRIEDAHLQLASFGVNSFADFVGHVAIVQDLLGVARHYFSLEYA